MSRCWKQTAAADDGDVETAHSGATTTTTAAAGTGPGTRRSMHPMAVVAPAQKYIELLVTNDNARWTKLQDQTEINTNAIVSIVKATYDAETNFKPLVTVVLIGQITWQGSDPFTVARGVCSACRTNNGVSVDEFLRAWNVWRSNVVNVLPYVHDNAHLFSGFTFEVPTLGYAGVGAMCSNAVSGGVESILGPTDFYNAIIVAHEMGHNLGMNHDSTDNTCQPSGFIMNAILKSPTPTTFSTCSVTYEQNWYSSQYPVCMDNIPTKAWGNPVCGNGFVETGEQCDCGNAVSCAASRDPCCNATTCQFLPGATCSGSSPCCENCQVVPKSAAKVCRPAANSCDLPEVCPGPLPSGDGAVCPRDLGYAAGTECSAGQYGPGLCYLNQCFSYLQQCRTAGANFPGAPFDTCIQQAELNQGNYCGTLWCSSTPGQCTFFRQSGNIVAISDGVPCPDEDSNLKWQCSGSQCVNPSELNKNYYWNATGWSYCEICEDYQTQNVTCHEKATGNTVANGLCSPTNKPETSQLCVNPDKGCYGAQGGDPDVVDLFGYVRLSRKTLIFSTLGLGVAFLAVLGCCYQGVTFTSDQEELPAPPQSDELAKQQKEVGLTSSKKKSRVAPTIAATTNATASASKKKKKNIQTA